MICDELGTSCAEVVPAIAQSAGIGIGNTYALMGALLMGALVALAYALLRARGVDAPHPPERPVIRCQQGSGITKCTAPATRIVMVLTGIDGMETHVMCDDDAHRLTRMGRAIDLGPTLR